MNPTPHDRCQNGLPDGPHITPRLRLDPFGFAYVHSALEALAGAIESGSAELVNLVFLKMASDGYAAVAAMIHAHLVATLVLREAGVDVAFGVALELDGGGSGA